MSRWTINDLPDQSGRTAVITGANAGLGLETTIALARAGATVVMACRNTTSAETAAARIRAAVPAAKLEISELDLADLASVASFVARTRALRGSLDLLVNNAGLMAVDQSVTADGFETQLGVNHLGHHALAAGLLPLLLEVPGSRVATMSSMGHRAGRLALDDLMFTRRGYSRWGAYFQSKLANLLFTADLQRRLAAAGSPTIAVAAHPGASNTDLGVEGNGLTNRVFSRLVPHITQSAATGALPMLRALTAPDVEGGQFYGPRGIALGHPVVETPSRRARRTGDATALAAESARLTGVSLPL